MSGRLLFRLLSLCLAFASVGKAEREYEEREEITLASPVAVIRGVDYDIYNLTDEWETHWAEIERFSHMAGVPISDEDLQKMGLKKGESPHADDDVLLLAAYPLRTPNKRVLYGAAVFSRRHCVSRLGKLAEDSSEEEIESNQEAERIAFNNSNLSKLHVLWVIVVDSALQRQNISSELTDEGMRWLGMKRGADFHGRYATQRATNIRGLPAMLRAVETHGAELWGVKKMDGDKVEEFTGEVRDAHLARMRALRNAVADTSVSQLHANEEEDTRIEAIRNYMQTASDFDYYVWVLRKEPHESREMRRRRPAGGNTDTAFVTFREVRRQAPTERAAAVALVYASKVQENSRLSYDKDFVALGAFAGEKLIAVAVLFKGMKGDYALTDVVTSADYSPATQHELAEKLIGAHLLPWLRHKHPPADGALPLIHVSAYLSRSWFTHLAMLPHLFGLGFHVRAFALTHHLFYIDNKRAAEGEGKMQNAITFAEEGGFTDFAWSGAILTAGLGVRDLVERYWQELNLPYELSATAMLTQLPSLVLHKGVMLNDRRVYRPAVEIDDVSEIKLLVGEAGDSVYYRYHSTAHSEINYGHSTSLTGPIGASNVDDYEKHCGGNGGGKQASTKHCVDFVEHPNRWNVIHEKKDVSPSTPNHSVISEEFYLLRFNTNDVPFRPAAMRLVFGRDWKGPLGAPKSIFAEQVHSLDGKMALVEVRGVLGDALHAKLAAATGVNTRTVRGPFKVVPIYNAGKEKRVGGVAVKFESGDPKHPNQVTAWIDENGWPRLQIGSHRPSVGYCAHCM